MLLKGRTEKYALSSKRNRVVLLPVKSNPRLLLHLKY
jgi:hypothetical protein